MTPIRARIVSPPLLSATRIKTSTAVCNVAGLPMSHGLRKAAATYLADRGATTTQLMAWFGWKTASEAERYTRGADRKRNAAAAGELVSGTGIGKPEIQFAKKATKPEKSEGETMNGDPSRIAPMRYKSISCPKLLTNLLASGHAVAFRFFGKVTNLEQSIIGSSPFCASRNAPR